MNMRRLASLVMTDDFRQRRRITVILMTVAVYLMSCGILAYGAITGLFPPGPAKVLSVLCAIAPTIFYGIFRSGLNLRFAEPSLAFPQAMCAQTLVGAAYVVTGPAHGVALVLLATVMVFGMFEMRTPNVWKLMIYTIVMMGVLIAWRTRVQPDIYDPRLELMYFVMMATVIPSISSLAVQLRHLRERLRSQKAELAEALEQVRRVATHDELTGLPNRRHMLTLLSEHIVRYNRGAPGFAVALVDMDHFKRVNDTFGHRVGDAALICFAKQARQHLRASDIVGRWGGEEFLIILPESVPGDPNIGIERLRGALAVTEVSPQAPHLRIAFSSGMTRYADGEEIDDVIERADGALYAAKAAGRNQTMAR